MFQVLKLGERYWAVFLVNPKNDKDRYIMTSPLDKRQEAEHFKSEFERIANVSKD
jgi:hypothetical protein